MATEEEYSGMPDYLKWPARAVGDFRFHLYNILALRCGSMISKI